jgi:hypothetical protein
MFSRQVLNLLKVAKHIHDTNGLTKKARNLGYNEEEGYHTKQQLATIVESAAKLYKALRDDDDLPEWVQSKVAITSDAIDKIWHYMNFRIQNPEHKVSSHLLKLQKLAGPDPSEHEYKMALEAIMAHLIQSQYLFYEAQGKTKNPLKKIGLMGVWQDINNIINGMRKHLGKTDKEFTEADISGLGRVASYKSNLFKKAMVDERLISALRGMMDVFGEEGAVQSLIDSGESPEDVYLALKAVEILNKK